MSFSFGAPSSAPATSSLTTGFSFGATSNTKPTGFGAAQPATTGLFGATSSAAPTFGAPSTTFPAFGATSTAAPAFGATSAPAPAFGSSSLNFGTSTTGSTGLNFGTSSAAPGGLSFGTSATTSAPSLGFGLLGSTPASTATSLFGLKPALTTTTQPAATVNVGLGGIASNSNGTSTTASKAAGAAEQQPRQQQLPPELNGGVDALADFLKKQKALAADVARVSVKPLLKVSSTAEETARAAAALCAEAARSRGHARRLRATAARALAAAESTVRDQPGSDFESGAPPPYVSELIAELESQLLALRKQTDVADRRLQAPHRPLTQQELSLGMRRMHEALVALAGRLHALHAQVEQRKRQYLELRRTLLHDNTDVFRTIGKSADSLDSLLRDADAKKQKSLRSEFTDSANIGSLQKATGPTPFSYLSNTLSSFPAADSSGASWAQPASQTASPFGASGVSSLPPAADTSAFQLQRPPGKRGKQ